MLHELSEDAVGRVVPLFEAGPPTYAQVIIRAVAEKVGFVAAHEYPAYVGTLE